VIQDSDVEKEVIYSELGFLYVEADQFEDGIFFLEKSLKHNPENVDALSDLAYAYESLGFTDKAIEVYNKILDTDPYSYNSWVGIGKLYSLKDEFVKAIDAFEFAVTIDGSDTELLKLIAHCLFLTGRTDEAISKFKEYIDTDATDESVLLSLADCYILKEMYDDALAVLEECSDLDPENEKMLVKKSYIYIQQGKYEEAMNCIDEGLNLNGQSGDLYMMKGELSLQLGELDNAEMLFTRSLDNNKNLLIVEKLVYISLEREDYQKAISWLKLLLDIDPDHPEAKRKLILIYFEIGDVDNFDKLLNELSIKELNGFLQIFYSKEQIDSFNAERDVLILRSKELIENRMYYKNSKH
jgi:tetratricopeptide (TPR) repeat protein